MRSWVFMVVILEGAAWAGPGAADSHLNCSAYAGAAVSQQEQNLAFKCGFNGPAWSADFGGHAAWCNTAQMADLVREDEGRKAALQQCAAKPALRQAACQVYAENALLQIKTAAAAQCGFGGPAWGADYAPHFNWCLAAPAAARVSEDAARGNQLAGCLSARKAAREAECLAYAQAALLQQSQNLQNSCGFTGGR